MGLRERFPRRPRLDARTAESLGVAGERLLAVAELDDGGTAVATAERLVVGDKDARRLSALWHEIDTATWDPEAGAVDVHLVEGGYVRLALAGDTRTLLPETLRERVQASVVLARLVPVRGRRGVRVAVRRTPDGFVSQVVPDAGVSLEDPVVRRAVEEARREVEAAAGLVPG